jgi:hypothetical protein
MMDSRPPEKVAAAQNPRIGGGIKASKIRISKRQRAGAQNQMFIGT